MFWPIQAGFHLVSLGTSSTAIGKVACHDKLSLIAKIIVVLLFATHFATNVSYCNAIYQFETNNQTPVHFGGIIADGMPTSSYGSSIFIHEMSVCVHVCLSLLVALERNTNKNYPVTKRSFLFLVYIVIIFVANYYATFGYITDGLQEFAGKELMTTLVFFLLHIAAAPSLYGAMYECVRTYRADIGQNLEERYHCSIMKRYNKALLKCLMGEALCHLLAFVVRFASIKYYGQITFGYSFMTYHYLMVLGNIVFTWCLIRYPRRNIFQKLAGRPDYNHVLWMEDRREQHFVILEKFWN